MGMTMTKQTKTMVSETIGVTGRTIQAGVGMAQQVERRAADTAARQLIQPPITG